MEESINKLHSLRNSFNTENKKKRNLNKAETRQMT